jgi:methyl-accepting chemotaxis protein
MANKVPRRKYIVDSSRQYKVLAAIVIYIFVAVLLTGILMFLPSILGLSNTVGQEQYAAAKEVLVLHKRFWPSILIVVVLLGGYSVLLFHRLFGPLYRLDLALKQLAEGDLSSNFKLRKKDFLKKEEKTMDEMINSLREKIGTLKKDNALRLESLTQLALELDNQDMSLETVKNRVAAIRQQEEKIVQGFSSFKIDNN